MQVKEIMESSVRTSTPEQTLTTAAQTMRDEQIGSLPVVADEKLVGIVTDRDIVVRCVAEGLAPDATSVSSAMSSDVAHCLASQSLEDASKIMAAAKIRRLPVVDSDHRLIGIVSLGDLARHASVQDSGGALREISEPTESSRDL